MGPAGLSPAPSHSPLKQLEAGFPQMEDAEAQSLGRAGAPSLQRPTAL